MSKQKIPKINKDPQEKPATPTWLVAIFGLVVFGGLLFFLFMMLLGIGQAY